MKKLIVTGGKKLQGSVQVSGAKNVALKAIVAASLTNEPVIIENIPLISDVYTMVEILKELGGQVTISDHTISVSVEQFKNHEISLDHAAHTRTSSMFIAPLILRNHEAIIPNPGGCRLGARPIDRTIDGLKQMGAQIEYKSDDGYFHAKANKLNGINYTFEKNTHTGTETMIIAASMAHGKTILNNAAAEPEIDELIDLLNKMGAKIKRTSTRVIEIEGVEKLHGTTFRVQEDRNEIVTFAIAAILTEGDIFIKNIDTRGLIEFIEKLEEVGGGVEIKDNGIRFYYKGELQATDVETQAYPGFMTDWQAPWAVLMTKAHGDSIIHETVFENRFSYANELKKMGAKIDFFNPVVENAKDFYNFNTEDDNPDFFHAIKIHGPEVLHDAVLSISDLRAGATLVLGALAAKGKSIIHGVEHLDRGYEDFDKRLNMLGADIQRVNESKL